MSHIFVPVVDQEHRPLMPTIPSRARRWLRSGTATHFWKGGVLCAAQQTAIRTRAATHCDGH